MLRRVEGDRAAGQTDQLAREKATPAFPSPPYREKQAGRAPVAERSPVSLETSALASTNSEPLISGVFHSRRGMRMSDKHVHEIEAHCPKCGAMNRLTLGDIEPGTATCSHCHFKLNISPPDDLLARRLKQVPSTRRHQDDPS